MRTLLVLLPSMTLSHQQINLKKSWPLVFNPFDVPPIMTGEAVGRHGQVSEGIGLGDVFVTWPSKKPASPSH